MMNATHTPQNLLTVLVADDAPMIRRRLARLIGELDCVGTVLESSDYQTTLDAIRDEQPDAVVLDMFMPGGTGLDVLHALATQDKRPRVFMLTCATETALRERCIEAGADLFLEKGAGFLEVVEAIRSMPLPDAQPPNPMNRSMETEMLSIQAHVPTTGLPATPATPPIPAEPFAVLIVEDHEFQCKVLARMVRSLGATTVLQAADGAEALAVLREYPGEVQLILSDLDMPNMDGMEFVRHLGKTGTAASLVITSTLEAAILNSVQTMCQGYGIVPLGVLEKPVTSERLGALMAKARSPRAVRAARPADPTQGYSLEQIEEGMRLGQFEPFFQPKVELSTGRIVGAEALARWRHPEAGVLAPYAFIGTLEKSRRIDTLTFLMLERSAIACRQWHARGLKLHVSVNLSLTSLADTTLADRLAATVAKAGLDPRYMTLEITETAAMTDVAPALENLARLRMRGFGLSIDDFGTGFSSMQQLGRIAFTELKIDRGFVSSMASSREARAIVESSIDMARRLGIESIAEGVETQAEWDALKAAGCRFMQGYFVSRPLGEQDFLALCARGVR